MSNLDATAGDTTSSTIESATDDRSGRAAKIISSAAAWSAGAGAIPVPLLDLAALATVQTRMLIDLSDLYGQPFAKESARATVSVLLGTLAPGAATGALVGSAVKAVPVFGWLAGMASMAAFGAAATYAIGKVFVRHFENGGSLATFSPQAIKEDLAAEFEKGKAKQAAA